MIQEGECVKTDLWYTEKQTPHVGLTCQVTNVLLSKKTPYQELTVLETRQFGRMLVLDGMVQTTIADEFVYHEMITHVAMQTHPCPRRVLVVGGGDGGVLRELVKYSVVEKAVLVEIDGEVVETSREYLPEISSALDHPRVEIIIEDGIAHVQKHREHYDVIIVDSTEPVGPATALFTREFYQDAHAALREDGIFVAQTESPFFNRDLIRDAYCQLESIFPLAYLYLASIPTYPSGLWSFILASKEHDPLKIQVPRCPLEKTRYYCAEVHRGAFALPLFVRELLTKMKR